jgi:hypothetical protein
MSTPAHLEPPAAWQPGVAMVMAAIAAAPTLLVGCASTSAPPQLYQ